MKVTYDEKTQAMMDEARQAIKDRTEYLVDRFNEKYESSPLMPSPREVMKHRRLVTDDPVLAGLQKALCDIRAAAIPIYTIVKQDDPSLYESVKASLILNKGEDNVDKT